MTHVCSVILIRRSFDIYHEQQKISLHNESILLLEKNLADDFAFCSPDTRRLDIDELTVCHYLQNIRQLPRNLGLHSKDRLLINQSPPMPLVTAIFDSFNESGVNSPILSNMLYLSCLSMFSHKKELIPLLFNSISTVSGKVERLISFDIAKRWYLRDIAERMYTSESLIKKKLQDENTCFTHVAPIDCLIQQLQQRLRDCDIKHLTDVLEIDKDMRALMQRIENGVAFE